MSYIKQTKPFVIPTDDGKLIEEHFGNAATQTDGFSIARMVAPAQWSEPAQSPDFDEMTLMVRGKMQMEIDGEVVVLEAPQSLWIKKGATVTYSNPYPEEAEYWSVCIPAFSLERVHRNDK